MRPFEAALKGAGQIGFTIISITFSLIAVFIPLLFMGGIIGRLFREFAVVVSVAVLASAFISLTLTPVMCSLFLKGTASGRRARSAACRARLPGGARRLRPRAAASCLRHQFPTLLATLGLMVATGYLYVTIPKGFFPQQDTGFIFGQAEARQDTSFAKMAGHTAPASPTSCGDDPAVSGVFYFAGASRLQPDREHRPGVHPAEAA